MTKQKWVPASVRSAYVAWLLAIGAGVFETVLVVASGRAGEGAVVGVVIRTAVFAAAAAVAGRMRAGHRWARLTLFFGLGVLGTLSLVLDPALRLIDGASPTDMVAGLDAVDAIFVGSRVGHVLAVLTACALMFTPKANAFFRAPARLSTQDTGVVGVVRPD